MKNQIEKAELQIRALFGMSTDDAINKIKYWKLRQVFYKRSHEWKKAENDTYPAIRFEAFLNTGNWAKAEKDENKEIREYAKRILKKKRILNSKGGNNEYK